MHLAIRLDDVPQRLFANSANAARASAGTEISSSYETEIVADTAKRTVEVPDDPAAALARESDLQTSIRRRGVLAPQGVRAVDHRGPQGRHPHHPDAKAVEMIRAGQTR